MKKSAIRIIIVLFFLIATLVSGLVFISDIHTPTERVQIVADDFFTDPSESNLRRLLNVEADGESAYLKMALVGNAFTRHTSIFRVVSESPNTERERESIETFKRLGSGVFEYYQSKKPSNFDPIFKSATWLEKEAQQAAPRNR